MAVLLGLLVAASYGSADFLGGFGSKTSPAGATVLASQGIGLIVSLAYLALFGHGSLSTHDALLSAGAGLAGVFGVGCLYRGLAVGRMSVVAPLSAVGSAMVEIVWGLAHGERPGTIALIGVVLALVAVAVVAGTAAEHPTRAVSPAAEIGLGLGAAIGFGCVLVALSETSTRSGLWPVVIARCAPLPVLVGALLASGRVLVIRREDLRVVMGAGVLDATANALLLVAVRRDLLSLVAPVAALYPVATVLLARVVIQERLGPARLAGLVVAVAGLSLITVR